MASVWYVGASPTRTVRYSDWNDLGFQAETVTFSATNGWSILNSEFTAPQLAWFATQSDFQTNKADGPRTGIGGVPGQPVTREEFAALQALVAGKANTSHTHTIANVTGLQAALDLKVDE